MNCVYRAWCFWRSARWMVFPKWLETNSDRCEEHSAGSPLCFHAIATRPPLCSNASWPNKHVFSIREYERRARSRALYLHSSRGMPSLPTAFPMETLRKAFSSSTRLGNSWIGTFRESICTNLAKLSNQIALKALCVSLWPPSICWKNSIHLCWAASGVAQTSPVAFLTNGKHARLIFFGLVGPRNGLRQCRIVPAGTFSGKAASSWFNAKAFDFRSRLRSLRAQMTNWQCKRAWIHRFVLTYAKCLARSCSSVAGSLHRWKNNLSLVCIL